MREHVTPERGDDTTALDRVAVANTRDVVLLVDGGRVLWVSPSITELLGWTPEEFATFAPADVTHPDDLPGMLEMAALLEDGLPVSGRARLRRSDDTYVWVESRMQPLRAGEGATRGWSVHSWRDVEATVAVEHALADAAHDYRLLAENASDVVVRGDNDGVMRWVSPSVTAVAGWRPEDLVGRRFVDIVHPDDLRAVRDAQPGLRAGHHFALDVRLRRHDGGYRWFTVSVRPLLDDHGVLIGRVAGWHDIQEQHEVREALTASEARLRMLTQFAGEMIVQVSPTFVCEWASPATASVVGWPPETLVGQRGDDLVHPDDLPTLLEVRRAAGASGAPNRARFRFRTEAGDYRWVDVTANPIMVDGVLGGFVSVFRDAEHDVAAEEELARTADEYRLLAERASDVVTRGSIDNFFEWASPSVERLLGWKPEELVGTRIPDLCHPDDLDHIRRVQASVHRGEKETFEVRVRARDGSFRWVEVTMRPLYDAAGAVTGRVASWRDIQEERAMREQLAASEQRLRLVTDFAGEMMVLGDSDGAYSWVSPASARVVGWAPDLLIGHRGREFVHPDDVSVLEAARAAGMGGEVPARARVRFRTPDGGYHWVDITGNPIVVDCEYVGFVSVFSDAEGAVAAEEALGRAANEYRLLAENASDIVARGSTTGEIEWISPSIERVAGWKPSDLVGLTFGEFVHPDDAAIVAAAQARVDEGSSERFEARLRTAAGGHRWMSVGVRPVFDEDGDVVGRIAGWRDIQEEHEVREQLAASEQQYRMFAEFAGELIALTSVDGVVEWASPAAAVVVAWDPEALVGQRREDLVHPDDLEAVLANRDSMARTGHSGAVRFRFRTEAGAYRWVDMTGNPVVVEGALTGFISVFRDVEEAVAEEESLRQREEHYETLANNSTDLSMSRDGVLVWVSPPLAMSLGYTSDHMVGRRGGEFIHGDDHAAVLQARTRLAKGEAAHVRARVRYADGAYHWYEIRGRPIRSRDDVALTVSSWQLIDDEMAAQAALERSERQFRLAMEGSPEGMALVGLDRRFLEVNAAMCRLTGYSSEWLRSHAVSDLLPPDDDDLDRALCQRLIDGGATSGPIERRVRRSDGEIVYVEHAVGLLRDDDGNPQFFVSHFVDITERKRGEEQLLHAATHDALTGLANRALLVEEIDRALRVAVRAGRPVAVLLVDLDHFKFVNDSLGHAVGDRLLRAAAQRIHGTVRAEDLVARHGGDEFVVLVDALDDLSTVIQVARRIVEAFREPIEVGETQLTTTASVGIAVATASSTADTILADADTAMYLAKDAGRNRMSVFNEELRRSVDERLHIENDLRLAVERGELELQYQPEIDLRSCRMSAVEALLRWHHPSGQLYTAARFVEVAEDTGLMHELGAWVVREALRQAAEWQAMRPPGEALTVRVNLSAVQLADPELMITIDDALRTSGADPRSVSFEITETAIMRDLPVVHDNVERLHERGFSLALDDFGTGYASLTYLSEFPVDVLKLDRSFVSKVVDDEFQRRMLAGVIALAESLGMTTTAEGIEELDQARVIEELGCTHAQGWLWAKALPAGDITAVMDVEQPFGCTCA